MHQESNLINLLTVTIAAQLLDRSHDLDKRWAFLDCFPANTGTLHYTTVSEDFLNFAFNDWMSALLREQFSLF